MGIFDMLKNAHNWGGPIWVFFNMSKMPTTGGGSDLGIFDMLRNAHIGPPLDWAFLNMSKMPRSDPPPVVGIIHSMAIYYI